MNSRVINTIGSLFRGPGDDSVETQARAPVAEAVAQERLSTASDLVDLQRDLARTPEADELRKRPRRSDSADHTEGWLNAIAHLGLGRPVMDRIAICEALPQTI